MKQKMEFKKSKERVGHLADLGSVDCWRLWVNENRTDYYLIKSILGFGYEGHIGAERLYHRGTRDLLSTKYDVIHRYCKDNNANRI